LISRSRAVRAHGRVDRQARAAAEGTAGRSAAADGRVAVYSRRTDGRARCCDRNGCQDKTEHTGPERGQCGCCFLGRSLSSSSLPLSSLPGLSLCARNELQNADECSCMPLSPAGKCEELRRRQYVLLLFWPSLCSQKRKAQFASRQDKRLQSTRRLAKRLPCATWGITPDGTRLRLRGTAARAAAMSTVWVQQLASSRPAHQREGRSLSSQMATGSLSQTRRTMPCGK